MGSRTRGCTSSCFSPSASVLQPVTPLICQSLTFTLCRENHYKLVQSTAVGEFVHHGIHGGVAASNSIVHCGGNLHVDCGVCDPNKLGEVGGIKTISLFLVCKVNIFATFA